jgi:23S rRNA-/tRNA-specific pseudouridylate synthase
MTTTHIDDHLATITILYEDADIVVVNKPPGVVVTNADTVVGVTIQEWFADFLHKSGAQNLQESVGARAKASTRASARTSADNWQKQVPENYAETYGTPEEIFQERGGVVHRLDKDTSGVLLLAKHPGALVSLLAQFKQRVVSKEYLCLVHGKMRVDQDTIDLPLARATRNRMLFAVTPGGRSAQTEYSVEAFFPQFNLLALDVHWSELKQNAPQGFRKRLSSYQSFSLLRCKPRTGRTHQIRVHLAHLRHPIVGDRVYGGKKREKLDAVWCPRQFLHAEKLSFTHPRTGQLQTVIAPLSPDLESALDFVTAE